MGVFDVLRGGFGLGPGKTRAISSPWTEGSVATVVWSDVLGAQGAAKMPLTREVAMTVPAVAKARNLIVSTIMRYPLIAKDATGVLPDGKQPGWMSRTDGAISPQLRLAWTVDDLLFYGHALWQVTRGTGDAILTADYVPYSWWDIDPSTGAITIKGAPVDARSVIYFPSHTDPLLVAAANSIRAAVAVQDAVARRARAAIPLVDIHHSDPDVSVSKTEAKEYVKGYVEARQDPDGAAMFTPAHITVNALGANADSGALVEARNAVRLDIANHTSIPAAMLDGSTAAASLTYVTTEGKRSEYIEYGVQPWVEDISARLSMDDVVSRGTYTRLDQEVTTTPNPSAQGADLKD